VGWIVSLVVCERLGLCSVQQLQLVTLYSLYFDQQFGKMRCT
jgi:hypothetical protein